MKYTSKEITERILQTPPRRKQYIIGIDGYGGSGKTTLSEKLAEHLDAFILHTDCFYEPKPGEPAEKLGGYDFNWNRFEKEVVEKLRKGEQAEYACFNWREKRLRGIQKTFYDRPTIIEGVYMIHKEYLDIFDFIIWVDTPEEIRLERSVARDGEYVRAYWNKEWLQVTRDHFEAVRPDKYADLIIDGGKSEMYEDRFEVKNLH